LSFNVFRPGTDSDKNQTATWASLGLDNLSITKGTWQITENSASPSVDLWIENRYSGKNNTVSFAVKTLYKVLNDGAIVLSSIIEPNVKQMILPRVGFMLEMPETFENMTWFGRGPWESYPDRKEGMLPGVYQSTVTGQWTNYTVPQEMCSKQDVRWLALSDNEGKGLLFIASDTMAAAAGHYRPSDFFTGTERIKHPYQFHPRPNTVVYLDRRQRPLGNATCGPEPLEKYELRSETMTFGLIMLPIEAPWNTDFLSEKARVESPVCAPVQIERDSRTAKVTLSPTTTGATSYYAINRGPYEAYAQPFDFQAGGFITAYCQAGNKDKSMTTTANFGFFVDKTYWKIFSCSSQGNASGERAGNAIDNDPTTFWHTQWGEGEPKHPHEIIVDMGQYYQVETFVYSGRIDMENGRIKEYEIYFSNNPEVWGSPAAKGQFTNGSSPQAVTIASKPVARYFKLIAFSEVSGRLWTSAAELGIEASAVLQDANVPEQVIFPGKKYYIRHIASGLYLQKLPNAGAEFYGDFCIHPLQPENNLFIFIFREITGFKSVYRIENNGKYIFNDGGGWRCQWGTANAPYDRIQIETAADSSMVMRGQWQKELYFNLDAITPGSFIFSDKAAGARWAVERADKTDIPFIDRTNHWVYPNPASVSLTVHVSERAVLCFYDLTGQFIEQHPMTQGNNIIPVAGFPAGEYLYEIRYANRKENGKWVKK
jgi:beta-galactosidase